MKEHKVVITGLGAVSPFGKGVVPLLEGLYSNKSAVTNVGTIWKDEIHDMLCQVGGMINQDLDEKSIDRKQRRNMGRTSILAHFSAEEAAQMAGLTEEDFVSGDYGVAFSSTSGSGESVSQFIRNLEEHHSLTAIKAGQFFQIMSHTAAANIACNLNVQGRVISPNSACSSAAQSIGMGYEAIKFGQQKGMICGGAEEVHVTTAATFDLLNAISYHFNDTPDKTPRPFDKDRDGTVCSEGAGALVLESEESAKERGAEILAEVVGFSTFATGKHMTRVTEQELSTGMFRFFDKAGISPAEVGYVNAHGTGTLVGDREESIALERLFKESATAPYVSSLKGHLGHALGASAALELIACIEMFKRNRLIPTKNLDSPDEACGKINFLTEYQDVKVDLIMKNSFAFGGINSVILLRRYING